MKELAQTISTFIFWGFVLLLITDNLHLATDFVEVHIESVQIENEVKTLEIEHDISIDDENLEILEAEILWLENKAKELDNRINALDEVEDGWIVHRDAATGYVLTKHPAFEGGCSESCQYSENNAK